MQDGSGGLDWGWQWQQRGATRFGMCWGKSGLDLFLDWMDVQSNRRRGIKADSVFLFGIC